MNQIPQMPIRLPGGEVRSIVSTVLGFGISVALFLAPFLGKKSIPGFEPLIAVFPEEHKKLLIPVSSLLIGVVALVVQFYAGEFIARQRIRRGFFVLSLIVVAGLVALLILYSGFVNVWEEPPGAVVIVGWSRLPGCGCPPGNTKQCIEGLAFVDLGSCWSEGSRLGVRISIFLSYLVSIEGFAGLAGLYVLQRKKLLEQEKRRKKAPPLKKRKRTNPTARRAPATAATPGAPEEPPEGADRSGAAPENSDFDDD